jgi:putative ABC transport system permease protein
MSGPSGRRIPRGAIQSIRQSIAWNLREEEDVDEQARPIAAKCSAGTPRGPRRGGDGMRFVLRMAVRELRASWRRLLFFFLCVALGVGAIVALRSVVQTVHRALTRDARALTAGDVRLQTDRPPEGPAAARLAELFRGAGVTARTDAVELATMVRPADTTKARARMVEVLAVEPAWPLYGTVSLEGGAGYSHALLRDGGALVRPELLAQLDLAVGDAVVVGEATFTIRGLVLSEPGRRLGLFSFGPRVLVDLAALEAAGLLRTGSRARYLTMLRVPEAAIESLVHAVRAQFPDRFVNVRSYRGAEDRLGEHLRRAESYLSLVGFVIALLGGIGVWSVTRVFVRQKTESIAVLKCLGAGAYRVLAVYGLQALLLGLAGGILGVGLAGAGLWAIPERATAPLGGVRPALTLAATAQGLGIGLLVSLLCSLVPLLEVRHVRPLRLLRQEATANGGRSERWRATGLPRVDGVELAAVLLVAGALIATAAWQANSLRVGAVVCGGALAVALLLHLAGEALVRLAQPLARTRWFALRHAVLRVCRPGNQTRVTLLAIGLGACLVLGVQSLRSNLLHELSLALPPAGPDLFLLDVQPDQAAAVRGHLTAGTEGPPPRLLPVVRARVTGVQGRRQRLESFEDVRGQRGLGREYVVTYRGHLEANERLVAGRFWPPTPSAEGEVSIEESLRERHGIEVGDTIRFDVLGRVVSARVTSVRRVDWRDARSGGFMFVFRPGLLDRAPHTYIAVLRGPADPTARGRLQRDLVARFPNVSAIDAREVARTAEAVLGNVALGLSLVGGVTLLCGVLILLGSVAMTRYQRLHESAVLKTLGATTPTLAAMLAIEYAALGALAGLLGGLGALGLSWTVCRTLLDIPWRPAVLAGLTGIVLTAAGVAVVGVLASLDVLRRRALGTLRAE